MATAPLVAPKGSGKEFEKPTPDVPVQAVLVEVKDLGKNPEFNKFQNKMEDVHKIQYKYEFAERDKEGFRKSTIERFRFSMHPKANLYDRAKQLLGGKEPPANLDHNTLLGTNVQLVGELVPSKKDPSKSYYNITAVLKLGPGMTPLPLVDPKRPAQGSTQTSAPTSAPQAAPIADDDIPF